MKCNSKKFVIIGEGKGEISLEEVGKFQRKHPYLPMEVNPDPNDQEKDVLSISHLDRIHLQKLLKNHLNE